MLTETTPQQLQDEATKWKNTLAGYISGINDMKAKLYKWAAGKTDQDVRVQIEHYHNLFHIQLINIHDLKHDLRNHIKSIEFNAEADHSAVQSKLEDQYDFLIKDLDKLKADFSAFTGG